MMLHSTRCEANYTTDEKMDPDGIQQNSDDAETNIRLTPSTSNIDKVIHHTQHLRASSATLLSLADQLKRGVSTSKALDCNLGEFYIAKLTAPTSEKNPKKTSGSSNKTYNKPKIEEEILIEPTTFKDLENTQYTSDTALDILVDGTETSIVKHRKGSYKTYSTIKIREKDAITHTLLKDQLINQYVSDAALGLEISHSNADINIQAL